MWHFPRVPLCLQILFSLWIVLPDGSDLGTNVLLRALTASDKSFGYSTFANFTQSAAEYGFGSAHTATITVDMLREDGCMIQF